MVRSKAGIVCFCLVAHLLSARGSVAQPVLNPNSVATTVPEFGVAISTPLPLLYLEIAAVREELKVDKKQAEQIDRLIAPWGDERLGRFGVWTDLAALREKLSTGVQQEINAILNPDQQKRLTQIIWRHREREQGIAAVINALANELKLSGEQREKFERLRFKRAEIILEQISADQRLAVIRREIHDANNDYSEKFQQLLTPAQKGQWADLLGEPFAADLKLNAPRLISLGFHKGVYLESFFQSYSFEPDFLANESVQKELKMEDDQVRKVKEFWVEWTQRVDEEIKDRMKNVSAKVTYRNAAIDAIVFQHGFVANNLQKLLSQKQWPRFRSMMIQHRILVSGPASAYGYPGVRELVGIKDDELEAIRKGTRPYNAGSKKELETMSNLIGLPFRDSVKFDTREVLVSSARAVANPKAELKFGMIEDRSATVATYMINSSGRMRLSDAQVARLREIAEDAPKIREILRKEMSNLPLPPVHGSRVSPEARAVEMYRNATLERCLDVLDDKQRSLFGNQIKDAHRAAH